MGVLSQAVAAVQRGRVRLRGAGGASPYFGSPVPPLKQRQQQTGDLPQGRDSGGTRAPGAELSLCSGSIRLL